MQNKKSPRFPLSLSNARWLAPSALMAAGVLASACTLTPPPAKNLAGGGNGFMCGSNNTNTGGGTDGGTGMMSGDAGGTTTTGPGSTAGALTAGTIVATNDPATVIMPISCPGGVVGAGGASGGFPTSVTATAGNPNAIDKYSQGYVQDPQNLAKVKDTLSRMTRSDKCTQMRGTKYGGSYSTQFNDIQRSLDTATIRGFHYRDASRGMNLGEDMNGAKPHAKNDDGTPAFYDGQNVGFSTAFPVSMARGAAFDLDLEYAIGEAIGDEMQAANETLLLAPCMNVLRHPRWGRAQETYGEDQYEIGRLASAMTVGVQQHIAANAKHFMAYDVENQRDFNNADMEDEQTLRETYGRHFRMVVQDGGVASVMASYNQVNGVKSTQNHHTLTDVLRNDFGFKGFVLSDWWAMPGQTNIADSSILKPRAIEAVKAGMDVELAWGLNYSQLESIVATNGGLTDSDIDAATSRILEQKFRFKADNITGANGLSSGTQTAYKQGRVLCDGSHLMLAEQAAIESMVLLKNDNNVLPIPQSVTKVAVLGATVPYVTGKSLDPKDTSGAGTVNFAKDVRTGDLGSSRVFPNPSESVGPYEGIQMTAPSGVNVMLGSNASDAADADFVVVVAGLTAEDEGEEYTRAGDRLDKRGTNDNLALDAKQTDPKYSTIQDDLIKAVAALGKPMVVVLEGGSVIHMPWLANVPAVVMAWYPGQRGGVALGKLLWGQANFSGKLPITWSNEEDFGTFIDGTSTKFGFYVGYKLFDNKGITPTYAFGHGLSYTTFAYSNLQLGCSDMSKGAVLPVAVNVKNTGAVAGDEIVMVFVSYPDTTARRPAKELKGFGRVSLQPGEEKQVVVPVRLSDLDYFQQDSTAQNASGKWVVETGKIKIQVGPSADNLPLSGMVNVNGYGQ